MRALLAILGLLALAGTEPALGEVYRWTDAEGRLHFTENLDRVPRKQRAAAREAVRAEMKSETVNRFQTFEAPRREARPRAYRAQTLQIPFERYGTLMRVEVLLNDRLRVPFYVDTGASGISLPEGVADQLGLLDRPNLGSTLVRTANGVVSRSVVRLDSVEVNDARVENLEATVNPSMRIGLLGGTFFNNFIYRVDAAEQIITLQTNDGIRGGFGADHWRDRFRAIRAPLARLAAHLESIEISRDGRRADFEGRLARLEQSLEDLEIEANRAQVPASWRE